MTTILDELWYGNICPNNASHKVTKEERKLAEHLADYYDSLFATLSDGQKEMLRKFTDCYDEISDLNERDIFAYAFSLGAKIAIEIMRFSGE